MLGDLLGLVDIGEVEVLAVGEQLRRRLGLSEHRADVVDHRPAVVLGVLRLPDRHRAPGQSFADAPEVVGVGEEGLSQSPVASGCR